MGRTLSTETPAFSASSPGVTRAMPQLDEKPDW